MGSFEDRIEVAERLEQTFIETFNKCCDNYKIIKYGIESTQLSKAHKFIRFCYDDTSRFVRYIPDSILINTEETKDKRQCNTTLIEFKAATTGVKKDNFLQSLKIECPHMIPQFEHKEDIFNVESDALDLYMKLRSIGVRVVIIAYAGYRHDDDRIRAQFVDKIAKCNEYDPNLRGENIGSGTKIANINFLSFAKLFEFFNSEFGIDKSCIEEIENAVRNTFTK